MRRLIKIMCFLMSLGTTLFSLSGCSTPSNALTRVNEDQFITKNVTKSKQQSDIIRPTTQAELLASQPSEIKQAFLQYQKTGKAPLIQTELFQEFPFGDTQPIVLCEPLKVCDIELAVGERVTGIRTGDSVRWKYDIVYSGEGDTRQPHVVFKPRYTDLSTNVIITTTQRTYYIGLLSKEGSYVRQAKFYYPDDIQKQLNQMNQQSINQANDKERNIISPLPAVDLTQLDDHYQISTPTIFNPSPSWKPVRAFNDGTHVYIQMPAQLRVTDSPVLFIQDSDGKQEIVNYRVKNNFYIVDLLFKQAMMVTGVGATQQKIMITYHG